MYKIVAVPPGFYIELKDDPAEATIIGEKIQRCGNQT